MATFKIGHLSAPLAIACLLATSMACDPELDDPAAAEAQLGDADELLRAYEAEADELELLSALPGDDELSQAYESSALFYTLSAHGGIGGSPGLLACDPGDVAVGIYGGSGDYLDRIGLACADLHDDGTLGPSYDTNTLGGPGGGSFRRMCPFGQAIVGFHGRSGDYVDRVGVYCSRVENWLSSGTTQYTTSGTGGGGGGAFADWCPSEYVVSRMLVRTGKYVDRIEPQCAYVYP